MLIVFGLKKQDLSSCHKTDPECSGTTVWDDNFSLDVDGSQQAILVRVKMVYLQTICR